MWWRCVKNIRFWSSASPKSELIYLRKFEGLLEVIMDDTDLMLSDGKSVCISTRDALWSMLEEGENTEYRRRIDLLVSCAHLDTKVELSSIEFKKEDASFDFAGNNSYIFQMYYYKDVMVLQKINNLHIPTHVLELDHLRSYYIFYGFGV
ncbi:hypothetical protein BDC45DRAFT_529286 [Circinella umbellata]|nr:hypothetical protein BDC45DRAFT_529286 [Circinella umbellata]